MKTCSKCKENKPLTEFYNSKGRPDGKKSTCISCEKETKDRRLERIKSQPKPVYAADYKKKCTQCGKVKAIDKFGNDKEQATGKRPNCKACSSKKSKKHSDKIKAAEKPVFKDGDVLICGHCKEVKSHTEFSANVLKKNGKSGNCKNCVSSYQKKIPRKKYPRTTEPKKCTKCEEVKPAAEFNTNAHNKNGLRGRCKACASIQAAADFQRTGTPEKSRIKREKQLAKDPDYFKKHKIKWRAENPGYAGRYTAERAKKDPLFRLIRSMRSIVKNALNNGSYKKNTKTFDIIGCTPEQLFSHFERQFYKGMTWENMGSYWERDHQTPLATGTTKAEIIALNHYTNMQPMLKDRNRKKSDTVYPSIRFDIPDEIYFPQEENAQEAA